MTDADAAVLHAEVAALQAVLISVLRKLTAQRPDLKKHFAEAFDEAETILAGLAVNFGGEPTSITTLDALRVVEGGSRPARLAPPDLPNRGDRLEVLKKALTLS